MVPSGGKAPHVGHVVVGVSLAAMISGERGREVVRHERQHGGRGHVVLHEVGAVELLAVVGRELERGELVDLVAGSVEEPVDDLAGLVEAQAVLQVVELDGRGHGQPHAPVAEPLHSLHLAVPVLAPEDPGHAHDPRLRLRRPLPRRRHRRRVLAGELRLLLLLLLRRGRRHSRRRLLLLVAAHHLIKSPTTTARIVGSPR